LRRSNPIRDSTSRLIKRWNYPLDRFAKPLDDAGQYERWNYPLDRFANPLDVTGRCRVRLALLGDPRLELGPGRQQRDHRFLVAILSVATDNAPLAPEAVAMVAFKGFDQLGRVMQVLPARGGRRGGEPHVRPGAAAHVPDGCFVPGEALRALHVTV